MINVYLVQKSKRRGGGGGGGGGGSMGCKQLQTVETDSHLIRPDRREQTVTIIVCGQNKQANTL